MNFRFITRSRAYHLLFLAIWLVSFRLVLTHSYQTIGHNWDWNFPALQEQLQRLYIFSSYAWNDMNFGIPLSLQSHFVVNLSVSLLAHIFTVKQIVLIIFFLVSYISYLGYKLFLDYFLKPNSSNYITALLFAFSPFLFNEIIGGSWYMWVSYAIAPFAIVSVIKYVKSGLLPYLLIYLSLSFFSVISLQNFVMTEGIIILYLIYQLITAQLNFKNGTKNYLVSRLALIGVNAYWLLPFLHSSRSLFGLFTSEKFTGNFVGAQNTTQDIISLVGLFGYLDRNIYVHTLPTLPLILFSVTIFIFLLSVIYSFFSNNQPSLKSKIFFWIFCLLIIMFIAKGLNPPFGNLTLFIFKSFPLMSLYRSPQHLVFGVALIMPIILTYCLEFYFSRSKSVKHIVGLLVVLTWISGWWLTGDLGSEVLANKKKDHIDFYNLSSDITNFYYHDLESKPDPYRTLFLPSICSPIYLENENQKRAQGGIAEYNYLANSTICSESNEVANLIDNHFCQNKELDLVNLVSVFNFRYLVLRNDVYPTHTACGILGGWNYNKVQQELDQQSAIKLKSSGSTTHIYELDQQYFLPLISIPTRVVSSNLSLTDITKLETFKFNPKEAVIFNEQNKDNNLIKLVETSSTLTFKKISPTKYKLIIANAESPLLINFASNFNPNWAVKEESSSMLFKREVPTQHLITNGYSNGWILDPVEVCSFSPTSCQTIDGQINLTLYLEYLPQQVFYFGGIITVLSSGLIVFIHLIKK